MKFEITLTDKGHVKRRESYNLEYKQSFQLGDNLLKYVKTLVGMANNKGGTMIFGIKDSPHLPIGMQTDKFQEVDPAKIDRLIREYFSPELIWESTEFKFQENVFGAFIVKESEVKPIVCKKSKDLILREGAIYYRYRAETKEIEYPELRNLLDKEKDKEKNLWMTLIQKIGNIGAQNISLLDTYKGEINIGNQKVLMDEKIIKKLKFIKEGNFTEKEGEGFPTLKLIGDVDGTINLENSIHTDSLYPFLFKDIVFRLGINRHDFTCILEKLKIKGNTEYHVEIRTGENSNPTHKYSEHLIKLLERKMKHKDFLTQCRTEYRLNNPIKTRKRKR